MKPTKECDQQERMLRALLVLDGLTYFLEDMMNEDPTTPVEYFVHEVYAIAHAAHGSCCVDSNWLDRIDKTAELLKKAKIMDVEKILQEIAEGKRPKKHDGRSMLQVMEDDLAEKEATV